MLRTNLPRERKLPEGQGKKKVSEPVLSSAGERRLTGRAVRVTLGDAVFHVLNCANGRQALCDDVGERSGRREGQTKMLRRARGSDDLEGIHA